MTRERIEKSIDYLQKKIKDGIGTETDLVSLIKWQNFYKQQYRLFTALNQPQLSVIK